MGFHDMIVLACWRPTLCGARDRAFSGGKLLAGNVYWAHSGEHLWQVREEKEGQYLLWVPLADHCRGLRGVPASALMDIWVTMICGTL